MSFEQVVGSVSGWSNSAKTLAAVGAELAALHAGAAVPPAVRVALQEAVSAAGLDDLAELPPQQAQSVLALIRTYLHEAVDIVDNPTRAGAWSFTDTAILDGYGRASMMVPVLLSAAHPEWAPVRSFLDVGTGVGLLAVSATNVWPECTVVGIDTWEPSLERGRKNVADAGLADRITLRNQDLVDLDDRDTFDLAWVPSIFMSEDALAAGLPAVTRALQPGGRVVVAVNKQPTDPLVAAIAKLEGARSGGSARSADSVAALLTQAGLGEVAVTPGPVDFVVARRSE